MPGLVAIAGGVEDWVMSAIVLLGDWTQLWASWIGVAGFGGFAVVRV